MVYIWGTIPTRSARVRDEIYISCAAGPDHKVICLIPLVRPSTCPALKYRTAANARGVGIFLFLLVLFFAFGGWRRTRYPPPTDRGQGLITQSARGALKICAN